MRKTYIDSESVCQILAAVRSMAGLTGTTDVSLRVSLSGEECSRCRRVSETFIEPARVCTTCWTVLVLNGVVDCLREL
jgi:hypothetical protein